ncbi:serine/threonine-protein kinase ATG1c-like [Aristolochia californica]|uniref:serine/threonine-protein kinase ATG1c-like n=1 Tax=Aristolochia californica TaxID=171875 RepID=UPI0035E2089D
MDSRVSMAQTTGRARVIGDYIVGRQIGSGSFSTVWHGRHRVHGTEVAIKEIIMERLNKKLQDSLVSEIVILKKINHPNIIRLHEIIETTGRIHLVLEYCRGGDLSVYIQRHGSVPEATAKYYMQQLAAGLLILRENNLIHRDLKPQNLLLLTNDNYSVMKIADFGFARSLQPRGLAETLCGSPLYMAPEIMQLQKYDAKADLWSVGTILFQLVTGKTPFTGNNQIQLLQNIMKSNELHFPADKKDLSSDCLDLCQKLLRRNPVERLTFEEFFNHRFLCQTPEDDSLTITRNATQTRNISSLVKTNSGRQTDESSQDDFLPFLLDDDSNVTDSGPSFPPKTTSAAPTYGFSQITEVERKNISTSSNFDIAPKNSITHKVDKTFSKLDGRRFGDGFVKHPSAAVDKRQMKGSSKVVDSLELLDQDYVLVSSPPVEVSSSSMVAKQPRYSPSKLENSPITSVNNHIGLSAPMPITGAIARNPSGFGSLGSNSSIPSGASQGSTDMGDALEQSSTHCMTRIRSLQQCAHAISELVNEKIESGKRLEAFSIQLVILAISKQALHICHAQAASAIEGSPTQELMMNRGSRTISNRKQDVDCQGSHTSMDPHGSAAVGSQIEREFLLEVGHAEDLARDLGPSDGNTEMPDAMETIFQSALALGRHGAVDELMGDMESAINLYSKAVRLLSFLLVEAPSLILNPPFSLTNSDRFRLRSYIDVLNNRQSYSMSQRVAFLRNDVQPSPSP